MTRRAWSRLFSPGSISQRSNATPSGEHSPSGLCGFELLEERNLFSLEGNQLFPDDNPWNQVISAAPVASNSSTLVGSIGASGRLHPDFGTIYEGAYIGIPFVVVSASQPKVQVIVDAYPDESDLIDVPIPAGAPLEGDPLPSDENDGDRHLIVYDEDNNIAYELYNVHRPTETSDGKWHADSIAFWDMDQNYFRTPGDTSADAAGLPILPGLVRPDEVLDQGLIDHALRFTVPRSRNQYVYPASHQAGVSNTSYPRMGERFRLKADFDISGFSPTNQVILRALKEYGMIVADNGSGWYLSGQPSSRWDDDELSELADVIGSNFEAVDLRPVVTQVSPASSSYFAPVTLTGLNFSGAAGQLQVLFGGTPATNVTIQSDSTIVVTPPFRSPGTVQVTVVTPYGTSATSAATQFTYLGDLPGSVTGRHIFYNQSAWDGNSAAINPTSDNAARATDKSAYLPGAGIAVYNNITSYGRGINGIMVDLAPGGNHAAISASDFVFKVGNSNTPSSWLAAPAPAAVSVVAGSGVGGSDRVIITWASGSIANKWLEVRVLANANTGLSSPDVHFWGNKIADSGSNTSAGTFSTTSADAAEVFANLGGTKPITDLRDYNRSKDATTADAALVFGNLGTIVRINIPAGGPFAPIADYELVAVATALALRDDAVANDDRTPINVAPPAGDNRHVSVVSPRELERHLEAATLRRPLATNLWAAHDMSFAAGLLDDLLEDVAAEILSREANT